jgi:hypothetical protein
MKDYSTINPCDQFCPLEGVPCGLPEPLDVKAALIKGYTWMCHSNPSRPCATTIYFAEDLGINPEDLEQVTEPDDLFTVIQKGANV